MSVSRNSARSRSSAGTFASADPAASAAALVVVMTMSLLLEVSPPPMGPKRLAYNPVHGVDACQHACRHTVRDAADCAGHTRNKILLEEPAVRRHLAQPLAQSH